MSTEVLSEQGIQNELRWLYEHPDIEIAVDTETTGLRVAGDSELIGVSVAAFSESHASSFYVPVQHSVGFNVSDRTLTQLRFVLAQQPRRLIFANAQFDILALESVDIRTEYQNFYDIIVMAHLMNENDPISKGLDSLAKHYLKIDTGKVKDPFIESEKKSGWRNTDYQTMWEYATVDTELTWRVYRALIKRNEWNEIPAGLWQHKQALVRVLLAMRRRGVRIDQTLAAEQIELAEAAMLAAKEQMGLKPTDPLGPKALERLIHTELGIPVLHRTPAGKPSFDGKVAMPAYEPLIEAHDSPVAKALKEFRGWQKTSSAAYKPYLALADSDGRLRCSYKMHGTVTGRLSCAEPNLQQIPKTSDKEWNGRVKECFIADNGYTLINADFSQLELRLATAYAPDPKLVEVFSEGRDIFTEMSAQLGMTRQDTKTLVYSMQYGAGINRLMNAFHISKSQAESVRDNYNSTYPMFRRLNAECTRYAENNLSVKMWSGRLRRFKHKNDAFKAMNSMIQGGAADIVERIMVRLFDEVDSDDCRMLLQVHDSVTFEVRTERVAEFVPQIRRVMEDVDSVIGFSTGVRFAVDIQPWSIVESKKLGLAA